VETNRSLGPTERWSTKSAEANNVGTRRRTRAATGISSPESHGVRLASSIPTGLIISFRQLPPSGGEWFRPNETLGGGEG
jgi:hypothetical protein